MRTITCTLFCIFLTFSCISAQTHFNEWIDYNQTYYKFQIDENGIYRISYETLQAVGLEGKTSEGFHLFVDGKEIPIFPSNDVNLSEGDYIEFYGEQNDGSFDTQLFAFESYQLTDRRSLFTDKATYFLLWDDTFEGLRYESVENDLSAPLPEQERYFMHTESRFFENMFNPGERTRIAGLSYVYPDFEKGEGWLSLPINGEMNMTEELTSPAVYTLEGAPVATLETKVVGMSNDFFSFQDHHFRLSIGGEIYVDELFEGFDTPIYSATIAPNDLSVPMTSVDYTSVGDVSSTPLIDQQSIAYSILTYPRSFDLGKLEGEDLIPSNNFSFALSKQTAAYFEASNFDGGASAILYDLTHQQRMLVNRSADDLYKIHLPEASSFEGQRQLFLVNQQAIKQVDDLAVQQFMDFQLSDNQGNYLLIYHPSLAEGAVNWVQVYADYRASVIGGGHEVVLVNVEELYDQFAYGIEQHPLAIRHFVNFAMENWGQTPEMLFLMGKSVEYKLNRMAVNFNNNLIPTFGDNPSDNYLGIRNIFDYRPQVGIGRLSARTPENVRDYLTKVQAYENLGEANRANRLWRKQAFFQIAGNSAFELTENEDFVSQYSADFAAPLIGGEVLDTQLGNTANDNFNSRSFIEEGVGFLGLFGGTILSWDFDVEQNPNAYTQNSGRYPFVLLGAPFSGSIHNSPSTPPSMSENWVLPDNVGGICFLSGESLLFPSVLDMYNSELMSQLRSESYGLGLGQAIQTTLENVYIPSPAAPFYEGAKLVAGSFTLQGDPAVRPAFSFDRPEYLIENGYEHRYIDKGDDYQVKTEIRDDVILFDQSSAAQIQLIDGIYGVKNVETLQLQLRIGNLGKAIEGEFVVEVRKQDLNGENSVVLAAVPSNAPLYESMLQLEVSLAEIEEMDYQLVVEVDADNAYEEDSKANNVVVLQLSNDLISDIATPPMLENIEIFPNPFQAQLHIGGELSANAIVELFDLQGKLWFRETLGQRNSLSVSKDLPKGVYLLKIRDKGGVWMEKVVKE